MKQELSKSLMNKFPASWFERIGGIEVGDGWVDILNNLLTEFIPLAPPDFKVLQIKEKFGGLRVYHNSNINYDALHIAILKAEMDSYKSCDVCGNAGTLTRDGWWRVRCDEHINTR